MARKFEDVRVGDTSSGIWTLRLTDKGQRYLDGRYLEWRPVDNVAPYEPLGNIARWVPVTI